jgi:hypothetical protein
LSDISDTISTRLSRASFGSIGSGGQHHRRTAFLFQQSQSAVFFSNNLFDIHGQIFAITYARKRRRARDNTPDHARTLERGLRIGVLRVLWTNASLKIGRPKGYLYPMKSIAL